MSDRSLVMLLALGVLAYPISSASAKWMVFFAPGSSELTNEARESINTFLTERNAKCPLAIELVGHVDAAEARAAPILLDMDRARAVASEFKRLGATAWSIRIDGVHVSQQLEETGLGIAEGRNRRVEMQFRTLPTSGFLECGPVPAGYGVPACTLILDDGTRCSNY